MGVRFNPNSIHFYHFPFATFSVYAKPVPWRLMMRLLLPLNYQLRQWCGCRCMYNVGSISANCTCLPVNTHVVDHYFYRYTFCYAMSNWDMGEFLMVSIVMRNCLIRDHWNLLPLINIPHYTSRLDEIIILGIINYQQNDIETLQLH